LAKIIFKKVPQHRYCGHDQGQAAGWAPQRPRLCWRPNRSPLWRALPILENLVSGAILLIQS